MLWAHSVHLEDIKCLEMDVNCEYDLVACPQNVTNIDFLFWKPTFQNCITSHKSLSKRILQFFYTRSLQQCIHYISTQLSARQFKQNEQHSYYFLLSLFSGEKAAWRSTQKWRPSLWGWSPRTLKAATLFWEQVAYSSSLTPPHVSPSTVANHINHQN